jgi:uncharacterized protein YmfQ (DUF2313 family)
MLDATPVVADPSPPTPAMAALCGLTVDDFHALLMDLLPRGAAWPRIPDTVLWRFWFVPAGEYTRVHESDCKLLDESFPCGATELLPEWAAMVGLPDECTEQPWPPTITVLRALICAKLAARGGQTPAYFIALAAAYGFTITITEHRPWTIGCAPLCEGTTVGDPGYWWTVHAPYLPIHFITLGCWNLCDPLFTAMGASLLECIIRRAAPAHTIVNFSYTGQAPPEPPSPPPPPPPPPPALPAVWNRGRWNIDPWSSEGTVL